MLSGNNIEMENKAGAGTVDILRACAGPGNCVTEHKTGTEEPFSTAELPKVRLLTLEHFFNAWALLGDKTVTAKDFPLDNPEKQKANLFSTNNDKDAALANAIAAVLTNTFNKNRNPRFVTFTQELKQASAILDPIENAHAQHQALVKFASRAPLSAAELGSRSSLEAFQQGFTENNFIVLFTTKSDRGYSHRTEGSRERIQFLASVKAFTTVSDDARALLTTLNTYLPRMMISEPFEISPEGLMLPPKENLEKFLNHAQQSPYLKAIYLEETFKRLFIYGYHLIKQCERNIADLRKGVIDESVIPEDMRAPEYLVPGRYHKWMVAKDKLPEFLNALKRYAKPEDILTIDTLITQVNAMLTRPYRHAFVSGFHPRLGNDSSLPSFAKSPLNDLNNMSEMIFDYAGIGKRSFKAN